jgi:hypothetical protein
MNDQVKLTEEQQRKVIASAEKKIIDMLLRTPSNSISDGYYGWHVRRYAEFIWQFAFLNDLEKDYIDLAVKSLLEKDFIEVGEGDEFKDAYIRLKKQYFASKL